MFPLVMVLMAAVIDVRTFVAHRTDMARNLYTLAEMLAGGPLWREARLRNAAVLAVERLRGSAVEGEGNTAGWMRVVVVTRGRDDPGDPAATPARNADGDLCNPTPVPPTPRFCEPEVLYELDGDTATAGTQRFLWNDGGLCGNGGGAAWFEPASLPAMPAAGGRFAANARVLPAEGQDPDGDGPAAPPAQNDWPSRNMNAQQWWVLVEICTNFAGGNSSPGLFGGAMAGFALSAFDASAATLLRRQAWGGSGDLDNCDWCGA